MFTQIPKTIDGKGVPITAHLQLLTQLPGVPPDKFVFERMPQFQMAMRAMVDYYNDIIMATNSIDGWFRRRAICPVEEDVKKRFIRLQTGIIQTNRHLVAEIQGLDLSKLTPKTAMVTIKKVYDIYYGKWRRTRMPGKYLRRVKMIINAKIVRTLTVLLTLCTFCNVFASHNNSCNKNVDHAWDSY